jgi:hypothetical protein
MLFMKIINVRKINFSLITSIFIVSCTSQFLFSQSKKDFQLQIDSLFLKNKVLEQKSQSLEDKCRFLDGELKSYQTNLLNLSTTVSVVSKTNSDLDDQLKSQNLLIKKLIFQNDSVIKVLKAKGNVDSKFIVIPENEFDSILFVVQNYFKAKKWEDRLPFVYKPDLVKPLMADAYQNEYRSEIFENDKINVPSSNYLLGRSFKIFVNGEIVYLKKTEDGFKIDWEATIGYNPKQTSVICSEKSTNPNILRVEMKLYDSYSDDYGLTKSKYISLNIPGCIFVAFISISNSKALELKKVLSDGKSHQVIIEGSFVNYASSYDERDVFVISKFIKEGWDQ